MIFTYQNFGKRYKRTQRHCSLLCKSFPKQRPRMESWIWNGVDGFEEVYNLNLLFLKKKKLLECYPSVCSHAFDASVFCFTSCADMTRVRSVLSWWSAANSWRITIDLRFKVSDLDDIASLTLIVGYFQCSTLTEACSQSFDAPLRREVQGMYSHTAITLEKKCSRTPGFHAMHANARPLDFYCLKFPGLCY